MLLVWQRKAIRVLTTLRILFLIVLFRISTCIWVSASLPTFMFCTTSANQYTLSWSPQKIIPQASRRYALTCFIFLFSRKFLEVVISSAASETHTHRLTIFSLRICAAEEEENEEEYEEEEEEEYEEEEK